MANDPSRGHNDHLAEVERLRQRAVAELGPTHPVTVALAAEVAAFAARAPLPREPGVGARFPEGLPPTIFTRAGLAILAARAASTNSARVRARLTDILWESGSVEHRRTAVEAPGSYLELVMLLRQGEPGPTRDLELVDALRRSGELALRTGKREVAESVAAEAIVCLEEALAERSPGTVRISEQSDQAFQLNPITCFGGIRSVISEQSDHPGEAGKVVA